MKRILAALCNTRTVVAFVTGICVMACVLAAFVVRAQQPDIHKYSDVTNVPREAVDLWLKAQVEQSGGHWNKDRYSFYIGFSTGGYGSDPVTATAMTRLAFGLMNNSLAIGDKVTPIAWEMKDEHVGPTITLTDTADSRGKFVDKVPDAPFEESRGGHDIERALVETIKHVPSDEQNSSIVLLLTNTNQSQLPDPKHGDDQLFGAGDRFNAVLRNGGWLQPTRTQFKFESKEGDKTVCITALFPKTLKSLGSFGDRYPTFARSTWQPPDDAPAASENLPNKTVTSTIQTNPNAGGDRIIQPPPAEHHGIPWWIWLLLAIIVVGVILFMVMGKRSGVQRPLQPVAVAAAAAPKVETIPGSLRITIGPDEQTITPLVKSGTWTVSRQTDGVVKLFDTSKPAIGTAVPTGSGGASTEKTAPTSSAAVAADSGTPLAKLSFGDDRTLRADADSGAQFSELQGTGADRCDSRSILIEPGKRVLCRVLLPDAASKTRFEIVYDTQSGKGSRV